ncbi:hypothetical protein JIX56_46635 [Streptomyces sp. CA-210063]|uniref:hypothetical protein n=1 Tax=Streptomyces sp. CA-210063 TaxID=2801029 RepID=UPI00214BB9A2|nr:hypothetical protein [Streptomyces sp. CA-210063]UUU36693.1 hypothetical protein JIX56_46635 [Streptomyces sp. CA-210063]
MFDPEITKQLKELVDRADRDPDIRAVVFTGTHPDRFLSHNRLDVPILKGFGMPEASGVATFDYRDRPRNQGSAGLPLWVPTSEVVREDGTEAVVDECGR